MKRIIIGGIIMIGLSAFVAGCSGTPTQAGAPCEKCNYGFVSVGKTPQKRYWCIVDGKTYDCSKNPAECPECRAMKDMK